MYRYATISLNCIQDNNNHTFRSLVRILSRSYACLLVPDLQRPESFNCELSKRQCGRRIECGGSEICEHKGVAASVGSEEVAAYASTSDSAASSRWIMHALGDSSDPSVYVVSWAWRYVVIVEYLYWVLNASEISKIWLASFFLSFLIKTKMDRSFL